MINWKIYIIYFVSDNFNKNIDNVNSGVDNNYINANHLKYSGPVFRHFLSKFFTSTLIHTFIPEAMLGGDISPSLKNGKLCKSDSENFRPIMKSSMLLKIYEHCLRPTLVKFLHINPLQFGFTAGSGPTTAISFFKEIILKYKKLETNVFCASLDLSKAFDRLNIKILIDKLGRKKLPLPISYSVQLHRETIAPGNNTKKYVVLKFHQCLFLARNSMKIITVEQ